MSASTSGANATPNGEAKNRAHHDGSAGRSYTVEQKTAVIRVRRCSPTAFYDILGLEQVKTTCSDGEIKKAYRKLSLLTHPDKNGYEGADEAFKLVSRAFQILSDADKKAQYDRYGGDPDSRFGTGAGSSASPFSGFARSPGGRAGDPMFEAEMSPEELFREFFGGGMGGGFGPFGGGLFDTGPGFVFNLGGGPGIRINQFGGGRPRRRPPGGNAQQAQQPVSLASTLQSLLPLLLLLLLPVLSSIFGGSTGPSGPTMRFDAARSPHTLARISRDLKVPYWVNPRDVQEYGARKWKDLDRTAEHRYMNHLSSACENEQMMQSRMMQEAQGFFYTDDDKMREARNMDLKNCRKLQDIQRGYR